jgi:hypothetical protein
MINVYVNEIQTLLIGMNEMKPSKKSTSHSLWVQTEKILLAINDLKAIVVSI